MDQAITVRETQAPGVGVLADPERRQEILEACDQAVRHGSYSQTTRADYDQKLRHFLATGGSVPCDADTLVAYTGYMLRLGWQTERVRHYTDAVRYAHRQGGHPDPGSPRLRELIRISRVKRPRPLRQARPVRPDMLVRLITLPEDPRTIDYRDAAMIAIGWGCALRCGEIVELQLSDLEFSPDRGLVVLIRRSKTDRGGVGHYVSIPPSDPLGILTAIKAWVDYIPYSRGFLFTRMAPERHRVKFPDVVDGENTRPIVKNTVRHALKERVRALGIDPEGYSPHSLRAGYATSLSEEGASLADIRRQTRHQSLTSLMRYIREADMTRQNALNIYERGRGDGER